MPTIYFIPGDSYPKDSRVDVALADRLSGRGVAWVSPAAAPALAPRPQPGDDQLASIAARVAAIAALLAADTEPEPPVLIGRSSGARVATLLAGIRPVAAVVCLGYPFRYPGRDEEPARWDHLAGLATPTLILQGRADAYGGRGALDGYPLSPTIRLRLVEGDHEQKYTAEGWDMMAGLIGEFLAELRRRRRAAA